MRNPFRMTFFVAAAIGLLVVIPIQDQLEAGCYKTNNLGKCGTDVVLSTSPCGTGTCITEEIIFENLFECGLGPVGYRECINRDCNKVVYLRSCVSRACVLYNSYGVFTAGGQVAFGLPCP